jgi:tetratricopeptide (TPR) repeat protein
MGGGLFRPIAQSLGIIARGLGQLEDAHRHFETALSIVNRMRALPAQAHIHAELADVETARGNASAAHEHQRAAQNLARALDLRGVEIAPVTADFDARGSAEDRLEMRLEGDIRTIRFEGRSTSLRDSKGLQLLEQLVSQPGREVHVLDLVGASRDAAASDSGPAIDGLARDEYRRHVSDLQEELEEAESLADTGRVDALRDELDFITRELARAYGLGGRERPSGSASERARVNVRRRLKDAIERIGEQIPDAGVYLENTIKTGTYCKYNPM